MLICSCFKEVLHAMWPYYVFFRSRVKTSCRWILGALHPAAWSTAVQQRIRERACWSLGPASWTPPFSGSKWFQRWNKKGVNPTIQPCFLGCVEKNEQGMKKIVGLGFGECWPHSFGWRFPWLFPCVWHRWNVGFVSLATACIEHTACIESRIKKNACFEDPEQFLWSYRLVVKYLNIFYAEGYYMM